MLRVDEDGEPAFQITADLEHFKRELDRYSWARDSETHNVSPVPVDKDNHLMDAWRYAVMEMPAFKRLRSEHQSESLRVYNMFQKAKRELIPDYGTITVGG